eukprot:15033452-Alexandrium_andersonii.AAC.1
MQDTEPCYPVELARSALRDILGQTLDEAGQHLARWLHTTVRARAEDKQVTGHQWGLTIWSWALEISRLDQ